MSRRLAFFLCALAALSTVLLASSGEPSTVPVATGTSAAEPANERGLPALFSLGDFDGDGRLDLAAVSGDGTLQLLRNAGEGRFEDVTERVGLAEVKNAALALWADYDGDGRLDLFVGARAGASRLFHNERGAFVDMSAGSGLASEGAVQSAEWLDLDGDGRLDLFLVTAEKSELRTELYRGLEGGFFEPAELPLPGEARAPGLSGSLVDGGGAGRNPEEQGGIEGPSAPGSSGRSGSALAGGFLASRVRAAAARASGGPVAPSTSANCVDSLIDQASPLARCLTASTTPTLGRLYPLSANLFVALGGNVGIGTTSPSAKLEVAGTARMTDTLTLNPGGDQALDINTGSIYKGGQLFLHTKGGVGNTGLGERALTSVTTGSSDCAIGNRALRSNTTGFYNTAVGNRALYANTSGFSNTAIGNRALSSMTNGSNNTACGNQALRYTTGGSNTAVGSYALRYNTSGVGNTAVGILALVNNKTAGGNTAVGNAALRFTTTGGLNTASGLRALYVNTTGDFNTASGYAALKSNTIGKRNAASGSRALYSNTTGSRNIALGAYAGTDLTTGNDNIAVGNPGVAGESATTRIGTAGTHTRAFVAGIRGVTTDVADAIPVVVDSAGQLGTVSSSRRLKKDIADMGDLSGRLLELRPVIFHYKQEQTLPNGGEVPLEYGLIAEEVAEVFPDLVVYDEEGKPFTVKYHLLSAMLLNEMKKMRADHAREIEELRSRLDALESRGSPVAPPTASPTGSR